MRFQAENPSNEAEAASHRRLAAEVFGMSLDPNVPVEAERNVLSLVTRDQAFAQRLDCRTYFVQDASFGFGRPAGVFSGPDAEQIAVFRDLAAKLEIPLEEVLKEEVLREFGRSGQCNPATREVVSLEEVQELGNFLLVSRHINGLPVWSSHVKMGLNAKRQVGFIEFHWPVIPETVTREAERLAFMVNSQWQPPSIEGAEIVSTVAGIIHTPAVGYTLDVKPAIRAIYRPIDPRIGRKAMLHLDRHGNRIKLHVTADLVEDIPTNPRVGPQRN